MIDRKELQVRLAQAFDLLKSKGLIHSLGDLAVAIGMNPKNLNSAYHLVGRAMTKSVLIRVADAFPDIINRKYMETGEGDIALPAPEMRPHFEAEAAAGFTTGLADPDYGHDLRRVIDMIGSYDFTISVKGDSMEPEIHDGDLLCCRLMRDRMNIPVGKVCVIDTTEGALVKVVAGADEQGVILSSFNKRYKNRHVESANVLQLALVTTVIHKF